MPDEQEIWKILSKVTVGASHANTVLEGMRAIASAVLHFGWSDGEGAIEGAALAVLVAGLLDRPLPDPSARLGNRPDLIESPKSTPPVSKIHARRRFLPELGH
ncbi:hypothetical protein [Bradyrhizobium brasilense]|uniref:hypothetical protein n=1 Tax=Bradyrhizobium brasilense TaxID=1419277 RepID=UPI0015A1BF5F|nr:hypothetical protein [Bradyrhizobium brasilense]